MIGLVFPVMISFSVAARFQPKFSSDIKNADHTVLHAIKVEKPPVIDGELNDPVWTRAQQAKSFTAPGRKEPSDEQTIAMFCHDDKNLYVAVICQDLEMENLVSVHKKNDDTVYLDDSVELFFGMGKDGAFYQLIINPSGVTASWKWMGSAKKDWDPKRVQIKVTKDDALWCLEMSIPLDQIPLNYRDGTSWKFNVCRNYYTDEDDYNHRISSWVDLGEGSGWFYHKPEKFAALILDKLQCPATSLATKPADFQKSGIVNCPQSIVGPRIDGNLNDDVWEKAAKITSFFDVADLNPAKKQTTVYVIRTDNAINFGIYCKEPQMEYLVAIKEHKSNLWQDDCVEIFLGNLITRQEYYNIMINPLGVVLTQKQGNGDETWRPEINVAVKKNVDSWCVELAIPFSQIPLKQSDGVWSFNVCRSFYTEEDDYTRNKSSWMKLSPVSSSIYNNNPNDLHFYHQPEKFGTLNLKKGVGG